MDPPAKPTSQLGLSRAPRTLVNRKPQLDLVESQVELLLRGGTVQYCVSNFSGVPGIGKSVLLGKIADIWRDTPQLRVLEIDMAQIFPPRPNERGAAHQALWAEPIVSPRLHFLQRVVDWLELPAGELRESFVALVSQLDSASNDDSFDDALATLSELLAAQPLLLLIDSWDVVPDVLPPWIERVLLLPLVNSNCVLALFGSQVVARWWQFEIRRRAKPYSIEPLNKGESALQIGCSPEQIDVVHDLTYGYPLANEYLYNHWSRFASQHELLEAQPQIMRGILAEVQGRVLAQISEELVRVLEVMTLFREFDVNTLRAILPQFYPEFAIRSQSSLMMSLKELLATRLVSWNERLRAYEFERTIRHIYVKTLRVNNPDSYENIRKAASEYYMNIIREESQDHGLYLVEYCYHALYKYADDSYRDPYALNSLVAIQFKRVHMLSDGQIINAQRLQDTMRRLEQDDEIQAALAILSNPHDWFAHLLAEFHGFPRSIPDT